MTTGEKIQTLRKSKNYTQEELAEIMGVSRQSISKWESDVSFPETEKLITLSKIFNCTIDYLLNNENQKTISNEINEVSNRYSFNKKKFPFVLITLGLSLATLILFIAPWFKIVVRNNSLFDTSILVNVSFYDLMFFNVVIDNNEVGNVLALLSFTLIIIDIITCIIYLYVDAKGMNLSIKIINMVIPTFILITMFCCLVEFGVVSIIILLLYVSLIACQFSIKKLRDIY